MSSVFSISLDFEKKWGLLDVDNKCYESNIRNVPEVIRKLLSLFECYGINASWGIVGCLLVENQIQLNNIIGKLRSFDASDKNLNASYFFENNNFDKQLFSGLDEIKLINESIGQEIVSHSFSHAYFAESGVDVEAIKLDCELFFDILKGYDIKQFSNGIIFPRNQLPESHDLGGYLFYRSMSNSYLDKIYTTSNLPLWYRLLRLADSYVKLSANRDCRPYWSENGSLAIPATRFLRPKVKIKIIEKLKIERIKNEMTWAAKNSNYYHLWWHPHNFGDDIEGNIDALREILEHFKILEISHGMKSLNMGQIYEIHQG